MSVKKRREETPTDTLMTRIVFSMKGIRQRSTDHSKSLLKSVCEASSHQRKPGPYEQSRFNIPPLERLKTVEGGKKYDRSKRVFSHSSSKLKNSSGEFSEIVQDSIVFPIENTEEGISK